MKRILILIASAGLALALLTAGISQEVPIGSLAGKVTLEENDRPMPHALVVVTPEHLGEDHEWTAQNWHTRTAADGSFALKSIPAGDYRIEVDAKEHTLKERSFTVVEGHTSQFEIQLNPNNFHLQLYASQKVLAPGEPAQLDLDGFVGDQPVEFELRKLRLSAVAQSAGVRTALQPIVDRHENLDEGHLNVFSDRLSSATVAVGDKDIEGAFEKKLDLPPLSEGLYIAVCRAGTAACAVFLNVSHIALIAKTDLHGVHCLVTDIDSGRPIPNAALLTSNEGRYDPRAKTGPDGLAFIPAGQNEGSQSVLARVGDSFAVTDFRNLGQGRVQADDAPTDPNTRIFTYADRPIYRPGDTIQYKAVIRHLHGTELRLPGSGNATIKVYDPNEDLLKTEDLPISSHGTVHGSFATLSEAVPGVYRIEVSAHGGVDRYYANLAAYRKPGFSIKVTPSKTRYCIGDTGSAVVECQYFFGGPVVGSKIVASIFRSPVWDDYEEEEDSGVNASQADDENVGGEFVQEIKAVTDGLGRATIQFPTIPEAPADGEPSAQYDYRYSVRVAVEEEGGATFEGSGSVLVSRGNVRLTASTDPFIASPGETATLSIKTASEDDPRRPAPNRPVKVEISDDTWTGHTVVKEPLQTLSLVTGPDGTLSVPLKIGHSNELQFTVTTSDEQGHKIVEQTSLYVEGAHDADWDTGAELKVRVDRPKYDVGSQVKALIQCKSPGGVAFLTVQADDIKMTRLVPLTSASTIVKFPLTRAMAPNAFIHVAYVRGRHYWDAEREIHVDRPDRRLQVTVRPDVSKALPGSPVTFHILTEDREGHGVPAEVSLGVVDESIYAIKRDETDIVEGLFPARLDEVETTYSFPEIFLDGGDKAGGSVPVRRKFLDTASWTPAIETDSSGRGQATVRLPDNLTSWRATAVAATDDTQVGMATGSVRASKPIMVRFEAPQFMVATDRQMVAVAITNDSGSDTQVNLSLSAQNVSLANPANQTLSLANGQTGSVLLDVTTPASGTASLIATVRSSHGEADAVESKWPVLPHGRLVVAKGNGVVNRNTEIALDALPNRDPNTGSVVVTISPSTMSGMMQSLDSLVQFPYGCVEQTMSRFLPAVLVTHAIKGTRLDQPKLQTRAAAIAADGFARLQKMQHADGAWGWWNYDDSDPFMTAWVLDGLKRSAQAGYPPPSNLSTETTLKWSLDRLKAPFKQDSLRTRLFLAHAVAEYGKEEEALHAIEALNLSKADRGDLALDVLAANECGAKSLRDAALSRLLAALDQGPAEDENWAFWNEGEYNSLTLLALEKVRPDDPHIPSLVNRLNAKRGCWGWESTRASSLAIAALCQFLKSNPEITSPDQIEVSLNGNHLKTADLDPAGAEVPDLRIEIPISKLKTGANRLILKASGGQPAFAYECRQFDVSSVLPAAIKDKSLQIQRSYYRLEPRQMPDGTQKLLPSDLPISSAHTGDIVRCEITIRSSRPIEFLMIEDPIPSNMRVTDREDPGEDQKWSYWWSSMVIRDDRVSLFARFMPAGVNKLSYVMRAEGEGTACALPTEAELMYRPEVSASGEGFDFKVSR